MFGRCKPRFKLGGLTIEETSNRQDSVRKASDKRRKETRDGSKDRMAADSDRDVVRYRVPGPYRTGKYDIIRAIYR